MDQKICLDTDACIAILNQKGPYQSILDKILYSNIHVSTVSVFELFLRKTNVELVENFIKDLDVLDFNSTVARKSSEIFKILKSEGRIIDMRDLFIASTAIVNGCTLITLNTKDFINIKELKVLKI